MSGDLSLNDQTLQAGAVELVSASEGMTSGNVARPSGLSGSLTGIVGIVDLYLRGLQVARAALADAATTGSQAVAKIMNDSTELDQYISNTLSDSYAVQGYDS